MPPLAGERKRLEGRKMKEGKGEGRIKKGRRRTLSVWRYNCMYMIEGSSVFFC